MTAQIFHTFDAFADTYLLKARKKLTEKNKIIKKKDLKKHKIKKRKYRKKWQTTFFFVIMCVKKKIAVSAFL